MKCIKCGHTVESEALHKLVAEFRGERLEVQVAVRQCSHCKRVVLDGKSRRAYHRAVSDAYRREHELLTARDIDRLRRNLGMTWKQFAEYVCVGIATLKRWMGGEIQTPSLDSLIRLKADLSFAQRAADDLLVRLANSSAYASTVEAVTPITTHRRRPTIPEVWTAVDTDLALCA